MSETEQIEKYLSGSLLPGDKLVMDAHLILNSELREKAHWQKTTYNLVREFGRKELRLQIQRAEYQVFTHKNYSGFREIIKNIFRK